MTAPPLVGCVVWSLQDKPHNIIEVLHDSTKIHRIIEDPLNDFTRPDIQTTIKVNRMMNLIKGQPHASYHGQPQAYQDTRRSQPRNHKLERTVSNDHMAVPIQNNGQSDLRTQQKRLIGKVNTQIIHIGAVECSALLDSGSVISSISKNFYEDNLSHIPIQSLEISSTITSATGDPLDMVGYIEVDIEFPRVNQPLPVLVTVLRSSILNRDMPALIGSNALETWRIALNKQYTKVPPTHPIIDTWSVEKNIVGVVRSVNFCDASMLNCAYIKSKLTVPIIKPYDRTVIITPSQSFNKMVASTTVAIPKYHSVVFFELPVLSTSQAKNIKQF